VTQRPLPSRTVAGFLTSALVAAALTVAPAVGTSAAVTPAAAAPGTSQADHALRSPRTYRMAGAVARRTVVVGGKIRLRGGVVTKPGRGAAKPRPIRLTERKRGRWQSIATTTSTRSGAWSFTISAGTAARTRVLRAEAPRFNRLPAARAGSVRVRVVPREATPPTGAAPSAPLPPATPAEPTSSSGIVTPEHLPAAYVPPGRADDWSFLIAGGSRWNPCEPIEWTYNPAGQGYDALGDVRRAFARISGVSGLTFTYVGTTESRYLGTDGSVDRSVDMVVGWANDAEFPRLAGSVIGIGGGFAAWTRSGYKMTNGYLTLDNTAVLNPGFGTYGWGLVFEHEVLHALGLGHAAESVQLMYPMLTRDTLLFGAGDVEGMQRIGAAADCF
jgi:hypothetical protein